MVVRVDDVAVVCRKGGLSAHQMQWQALGDTRDDWRLANAEIYHLVRVELIAVNVAKVDVSGESYAVAGRQKLVCQLGCSVRQPIVADSLHEVTWAEAEAEGRDGGRPTVSHGIERELDFGRVVRVGAEQRYRVLCRTTRRHAASLAPVHARSWLSFKEGTTTGLRVFPSAHIPVGPVAVAEAPYLPQGTAIIQYRVFIQVGPSGHGQDARRACPRANSVDRITYGEVMRSTVLCIALGLSIASAKHDPSFIPADDETLDPSLNYTPIKSVNYHGVLETAGRQPVLMAYLDDSLPNYQELRETYNRAVATFGCLAPDRNYMMPSGINVRARFIVGEDDVTMPSLSIFRRKRRVTFAGNWTEAELRVWVYKELAGVEFVEEDAEYDTFVKSTEKTAVRAGRGGLAIVACI